MAMGSTDTSQKVGDSYLLPRDDFELTRLNIQHTYMKTTVYEGRLIFDESVKLNPHSVVLDSGTGTGAWILDLAENVPSSTQLYGSDVSANNFPQTYPKNVHFFEASSTELPEEWTGKFDFVNQRMLMGALRKEEWPIVLSEVLRVLKPGGCAQFAEMDVMVLSIMDGPNLRRYKALNRKVFESRGLLFDAAQQLPRTLKDVGFVDITSEKKFAGVGESWGKIGRLGTTSIAGAIKSGGPAVLKAGVIDEDEFARLLVGIEDEFAKMEGTQMAYRMVCARKPVLSV